MIKKSTNLILAEMVSKNINEAIEIIKAQRAALGRIENESAREARIRLEGAIDFLEDSKDFASEAFDKN